MNIISAKKMVCCSKLCKNFQLGKEYELKEVSLSGNTYTLIDENGEWASIGSAFFCTTEEFSKLNNRAIDKKDAKITRNQQKAEKDLEKFWKRKEESRAEDLILAEMTWEQVEAAESGETAEYEVESLAELFRKMIDD